MILSQAFPQSASAYDDYYRKQQAQQDYYRQQQAQREAAQKAAEAKSNARPDLYPSGPVTQSIDSRYKAQKAKENRQAQEAADQQRKERLRR